MTSLFNLIQNLVARLESEERGATAVEYGLMVTLIAIAIITVVTTLGTDLAARFQSVVDVI